MTRVRAGNGQKEREGVTRENRGQIDRGMGAMTKVGGEEWTEGKRKSDRREECPAREEGGSSDQNRRRGVERRKEKGFPEGGVSS